MLKIHTKQTIACLLFLILPGRILCQQDSINYALFDSIQALNESLLNASFQGDESAVAYALKFGADVNCRTDDGITSLMYASQNGFDDIVKILVHNGANINLRPKSGITALIASVQYGHTDITEFLISKGAGLNIQDKIGRTALIYATAFNYADLVAILLDKGAAPNIKSGDSLNALIIAAYSGYTDICKLLIDKGADVNSANDASFSPLMFAAENGYMDVVKLLCEKGADVNHCGTYNVTALMLATENGKTEVVQYLLSKDVNTAVFNYRSEDAFKISLLTGQTEISRLLKSKPKNNGILPVFTKFFIGWGAGLNTKDCIFSGQLGLQDARFNSNVFAGFDCRYWGKRTLLEKSDSISYQLWEKRYSLVFGIQKNFPLKHSEDRETGFFAGAKLNYTFGKYKGMDEKIDKKVMLIPQLGVYIQKRGWGARLNYEYANFGTSDVSPHKICLTLTGAVNMIKYYYLYREIKWL